MTARLQEMYSVVGQYCHHDVTPAQPFYYIEQIKRSDGEESYLVPSHKFAEGFSAADCYGLDSVSLSLSRMLRHSRISLKTLRLDCRGITRQISILCPNVLMPARIATFYKWFSAKDEHSDQDSGIRSAWESDSSDIAAWWAVEGDTILSLNSDIARNLHALLTDSLFKS